MSDPPEREDPPHTRPYDDVLETVGWTPLIRLNRVTEGLRTPVYIKAESFNPGGSVKDRIGEAIIEQAEEEGRLEPGGTIVEGTSGNTGVGLAMAAAVKGYDCIFTIPDKMSAEKVRLLKAYGAEVIVTPTAVEPDHPDYYENRARQIAEERDDAILADQFYNEENPRAHYRTTGPELWEQTDGRITHFVASPGTGGTISGVGRFLKEKDPGIRIIAGDPAGSVYAHYFHTGELGPHAPYKVEGIGHDKIVGTIDFDVIDDFRTVGDRESFLLARRLTRQEGLLSGGSTGLIVNVALEVAEEVDDPEACVVCLLCDTGERYLSKVYNEEWLREHQILGPERVTADDLMERKQRPGREVIAVQVGEKVRKAIELIESNNVSQLPVLQDGRPVGSVLEGEVMSAVIEDPSLLDASVESVADETFPVVEEGVELPVVSRQLSRGAPAVLVEDDGEIVGILTRYDVLHHLMDE